MYVLCTKGKYLNVVTQKLLRTRVVFPILQLKNLLLPHYDFFCCFLIFKIGLPIQKTVKNGQYWYFVSPLKVAEIQSITFFSSISLKREMFVRQFYGQLTSPLKYLLNLKSEINIWILLTFKMEEKILLGLLGKLRRLRKTCLSLK